MISCVLLSAGYSQRFGSPKALASLGKKKVIEHLQDKLVSAHIDEVIVVLGAHRDDIKAYLLKHKKVKVVYNKDYNLGQTSSLKAGLQALSPESLGFFLLPVDFPLIETETIEELIDAYRRHDPRLLIPTYEKRKGHPPLFSLRLREELLGLDNNLGINTIVRKYEAQTYFLPVKDPGVVLTFNTQEEFMNIKRIKNVDEK